MNQIVKAFFFFFFSSGLQHKLSNERSHALLNYGDVYPFSYPHSWSRVVENITPLFPFNVTYRRIPLAVSELVRYRPVEQRLISPPIHIQSHIFFMQQKKQTLPPCGGSPQLLLVGCHQETSTCQFIINTCCAITDTCLRHALIIFYGDKIEGNELLNASFFFLSFFYIKVSSSALQLLPTVEKNPTLNQRESKKNQKRYIV